MEARRERLQLELRLVEAELRADEALRVQERERAVADRPPLRGTGAVQQLRRAGSQSP